VLTQQEEDALDDGFILCDLSVVQRKLDAWLKLFPRVKPFFAIKCNPDVMVASILGAATCYTGFDCASITEIRMALQCTENNKRRCVYAHPQRAEEDLTGALSLGVEALTFDGIEELRKVSQAHKLRLDAWDEQNNKENDNEKNDPPQPPEMILRLLVPDESSTVPLGEKFGAPPSSIEMLVEESLNLGLPVVGVSFHCGSGCHDPGAYRTAIKIAKDALDVIDTILERRGNVDNKPNKCTLLDIGGGYPGFDGVGGDFDRFSGIYHQTDTPERYEEGQETVFKIAQVVNPLLDELFPVDESPIQIISEPGRYFVEAAFAYCSRIYTTKIKTGKDGINRRHYYIAQGVQGLFKDVLLCGENFTPIPIRVDEENKYQHDSTVDNLVCNASSLKDAKEFPSSIHGPSGEEFDVVCADCNLPELTIGDWLVFDRVGAYTLSIAAKNSSLSIRYVVGR